MIIGEGIFFMLIFVVGALKLKKAFVREHKIQHQQRNFLLAVTHEFKSPLASIKLAIQTILKRSLTDEQRNQFLSNSRSEEHTSELQSLMRISYAVFCLK